MKTTGLDRLQLFHYQPCDLLYFFPWDPATQNLRQQMGHFGR